MSSSPQKGNLHVNFTLTNFPRGIRLLSAPLTFALFTHSWPNSTRFNLEMTNQQQKERASIQGDISALVKPNQLEPMLIA